MCECHNNGMVNQSKTFRRKAYTTKRRSDSIRAMAMRAIRILCIVVLVAGAALTAQAGYRRAKAELARVLIERAWTDSVRTGESKKPWSWADLHPVARLSIPRLTLNEYVLNNASPRVLAFGPGVVAHGATPGRDGNLVIAGHRTSWFLPLERIEGDDRIELEWIDARSGKLRQREYKVERIAVVEPSDVALLEASEFDALTLVTCYPFGHGLRSPKRFIVRASPVN